MFTFGNNGHTIIKKGTDQRYITDQIEPLLQLQRSVASTKGSIKILNVKRAKSTVGSHDANLAGVGVGFAKINNSAIPNCSASEIMYYQMTEREGYDKEDSDDEDEDFVVQGGEFVKLKPQHVSLMTLMYGCQTENDGYETKSETNKAWVKIFRNGDCVYAKDIEADENVVPTIEIETHRNQLEIEVDYQEHPSIYKGRNYSRFRII